MQRTRVKICGITRVEDALAAAGHGADAIGLVFHAAAARCVPMDRARAILAALPPFVTPVGLFVDRSPSEVRGIAGALGLRHIQLHGGENVDCVRELKEFIVLKAIRADRAKIAVELSSWRKAVGQGLSNLRGLVLETPSAAGPGGTGEGNDWALIRELQQQGAFAGLPPIIAAGGLNAANVAQVIRDIRPWAVDVSSGVEEVKGIKSEAMIRDFIAAASAA